MAAFINCIFPNEYSGLILFGSDRMLLLINACIEL